MLASLVPLILTVVVDPATQSPRMILQGMHLKGCSTTSPNKKDNERGICSIACFYDVYRTDPTMAKFKLPMWCHSRQIWEGSCTTSCAQDSWAGCNTQLLLYSLHTPPQTVSSLSLPVPQWGRYNTLLTYSNLAICPPQPDYHISLPLRHWALCAYTPAVMGRHLQGSAVHPAPTHTTRGSPTCGGGIDPSTGLGVS